MERVGLRRANAFIRNFLLERNGTIKSNRPRGNAPDIRYVYLDAFRTLRRVEVDVTFGTPMRAVIGQATDNLAHHTRPF